MMYNFVLFESPADILFHYINMFANLSFANSYFSVPTLIYPSTLVYKPSFVSYSDNINQPFWSNPVFVSTFLAILPFVGLW